MFNIHLTLSRHTQNKFKRKTTNNQYFAKRGRGRNRPSELPELGWPILGSLGGVSWTIWRQHRWRPTRWFGKMLVYSRTRELYLACDKMSTLPSPATSHGCYSTMPSRYFSMVFDCFVTVFQVSFGFIFFLFLVFFVSLSDFLLFYLVFFVSFLVLSSFILFLFLVCTGFSLMFFFFSLVSLFFLWFSVIFWLFILLFQHMTSLFLHIVHFCICQKHF